MNNPVIGYYSAVFSWTMSTGAENSTAELGAYISFDNVLHSLQVQINGQHVPPLESRMQLLMSPRI